VAALTGLDPNVPDGPQWFRQMPAAPLLRCESRELGRRLREEHSIVVPVLECQGRCLMRISIQAYNSQADVEALIGALATRLRLD